MTEFSSPFDLTYVKNSPTEAWRYLLNARAYVAAQIPPPEYRQLSHAGHLAPVYGDALRPAILDASYRHFGRCILSLSFPTFVPKVQTYRLEKDKIEIQAGFSAIHLALSLRQYLVSHGIPFRNVAISYDFHAPSQTDYLQFIVAAKYFEKGQKLISNYVYRGEGVVPLLSRMRPALRSKAPAVARKIDNFVAAISFIAAGRRLLARHNEKRANAPKMPTTPVSARDGKNASHRTIILRR